MGGCVVPTMERQKVVAGVENTVYSFSIPVCFGFGFGMKSE